MDDRVMGAFVMIGNFVVLALYGVFVLFSEYGLLVVKWTAFLAVTGAGNCCVDWVYSGYDSVSWASRVLNG